MQAEPGAPSGNYKEHASNSTGNGAGEAVYSYNIGEGERPGGLKVRWTVRVATGAEAARLDARQANAIRELLLWALQHCKDTR